MRIRQLCKLDKVFLNHTEEDREISEKEVPQESPDTWPQRRQFHTKGWYYVKATLIVSASKQRK